jgi:Holliday junction resolvase
MASTPEKKVKDKVKKILKDNGAYFFSPVTGGYGSSGVPDIVCCYKGRFIGIETKAGSGKPTALQEKNLMEITEKGGVAILINENGISYLESMFSVGLPDAGVLYDLLKE